MIQLISYEAYRARNGRIEANCNCKPAEEIYIFLTKKLYFGLLKAVDAFARYEIYFCTSKRCIYNYFICKQFCSNQLQVFLALDISNHSHLIIPIICSDWIKVFDQHLENADRLRFRIRTFRFIFLCLLC